MSDSGLSKECNINSLPHLMWRNPATHLQPCTCQADYAIVSVAGTTIALVCHQHRVKGIFQQLSPQHLLRELVSRFCGFSKLSIRISRSGKRLRETLSGRCLWEILSTHLEHALKSFFECALTKSRSIKIRFPYEIWIAENEFDCPSRMIW